MPPELGKVLPRPRDLIYLWDWLSDLMYPLSYTELAAWQQVRGIQLSRWEVQALSELDKVRSHGY